MPRSRAASRASRAARSASRAASRRGVLRRVGDLHPDGGTLRMRADTTAMHTFTLRNAAGALVRNTNHEAQEQLIVHRFLRPDDTVLEFGGGIGAQSIQINKTLRGAARARHHVFEPQAALARIVAANGRAHGCAYKVVHGALSRTPLRVPAYDPGARKWIFVRTSPDARGPRVPTVRTLPVVPTALVADCEGCLGKVLDEFPEILAKLRFVYVENDGPSGVYASIRRHLEGAGLRLAMDTGQHKVFVR